LGRNNSKNFGETQSKIWKLILIVISSLFTYPNQMKQLPVLIIGTDSEAVAACEILQSQGFFIYGFLYVDTPPTEREFNDIPVLGSVSDKEYEKIIKGVDVSYFIAINNANLRDALYRKLNELNPEKSTINAVHPSSIFSISARMDFGNLIYPKVVIGTNVKIGAGNIMGTGSIFETNCQMGDLNYVSPGVIIGNQVIIKNRCSIGAGTIIQSNVIIESGSIIAPGANISENIKEGSMIV